MKQIMYTVSLDNTVSEPSDIFTDKVDLDKFKTNIVKGGGGTPAIIDAVRYGRVVAVWMEQEGNEAPSLSIDEYCKVSVGSTNDSTRFYIRVYGGVAGDQQFAIDTDNKKTLENTLSTLMKEVGKKSMEGAMPMEYSLKYLCNLTTNVEWKLLRYYMSRVWSVKLRVEDNNDGATFHVHVFALRYGLVVNRYQYYRWDSGSRKSLAYEAQLSPKTLCIDIKVDVMWDSGKSDYNIMIPCIPYDTMEPNKKGEWEFKVRLGGTYLGNTKQFDCIPPQPGTYICNNNKTWLANSKNSPTNKYNGASVPEKTVLTDYYNYFHDQEETLKDLRERTNGVINYAPNFKLWTPISGPNGFRPNK